MRYIRRYHRRIRSKRVQRLQELSDRWTFRAGVLLEGLSKQLAHAWDEKDLKRVLDMIITDLQPALREVAEIDERIEKAIPRRERSSRPNPKPRKKKARIPNAPKPQFGAKRKNIK